MGRISVWKLIQEKNLKKKISSVVPLNAAISCVKTKPNRHSNQAGHYNNAYYCSGSLSTQTITSKGSLSTTEDQPAQLLLRPFISSIWKRQVKTVYKVYIICLLKLVSSVSGIMGRQVQKKSWNKKYKMNFPIFRRWQQKGECA